MKKFSFWSQVFAAVIAFIGSFIYGIGLGWSSPTAVKILDTEKTFDMTENQFAWAVSMNPLGGFFACFINGYVRDRFGSKMTILMFSVPSFTGWMMLTFSVHWFMVILGRLLIGIAAGGYSYNVLTYVGECSSKEIRGTLLSFYEISMKIGILFSYAIGAFLRLKIANSLSGAIVILYAVAFMTLPESPWFLLKRHDIEKAKGSLKYWRGSAYRIDDELLSIQSEISELEKTRMPFCYEIRQTATRRAFVIIIILFVFFQMCGINAVIFYSSTILIESGIKFDPFLASVFLGVIQVAGVFISAAFVDRFGRKFLMLISNAVMVVGLLGLGSHFVLKDKINVAGYEWLPLLMLCVYLVGFSVGVGSVTFVLMGELFSLNAKRAIAPIAQSTNFLMSFLVAVFFPSIASSIGMQYTFFIFAGFCCAAIAFIALTLPEIKGKSLIEIQQLLMGRK